MTLMKCQVALSIKILVELINDITGDLKFLNFEVKVILGLTLVNSLLTCYYCALMFKNRPSSSVEINILKNK